jgi:hypothetical protein
MSSNGVILLGIAEHARLIPLALFATLVFTTPIMTVMKCTFTERHQEDVATVETPRLGELKAVVRFTDPLGRSNRRKLRMILTKLSKWLFADSKRVSIHSSNHLLSYPPKSLQPWAS